MAPGFSTWEAEAGPTQQEEPVSKETQDIGLIPQYHEKINLIHYLNKIMVEGRGGWAVKALAVETWKPKFNP